MPEIMGIDHLGLTVSDAERSARWYQDVLGFERIGQLGDAGADRQKIFLRHAGLEARLGLVEHRSSSKRPFDETESGLDHLAFGCQLRRTGALARRQERTWATILPDCRFTEHPRRRGDRVSGPGQRTAGTVHKPPPVRPVTPGTYSIAARPRSPSTQEMTDHCDLAAQRVGGPRSVLADRMAQLYRLRVLVRSSTK